MRGKGAIPERIRNWWREEQAVDVFVDLAPSRQPLIFLLRSPPPPPLSLPPPPPQDPEGILAAPVGGHISRRELAKAVQTNAELAERVETERQKAREELVEKRAARAAPTAAGQEAELVTYFLDTEADEMEFEIARCRPALTADFFKHVDAAVGELRFAKNPDQGKLAELEVLRDYLKAGVEAFDANVEAMKQPAARMRKLLTAPDKKATLLQMAGDGEIDQALVNLLQQNIDAARSAGQEDPVRFLEKVRDAARKFVIT